MNDEQTIPLQTELDSLLDDNIKKDGTPQQRLGRR